MSGVTLNNRIQDFMDRKTKQKDYLRQDIDLLIDDLVSEGRSDRSS